MSSSYPMRACLHVCIISYPTYLCRGRISVSKMLRADIKSYWLVIPEFTILIKTLVSGVQSELILSHGHAEKQRGSPGLSRAGHTGDTHKERVTTNILHQDKTLSHVCPGRIAHICTFHLDMNNNGSKGCKGAYLLFVTWQSQIILCARAAVVRL